MTAAQLIRHLVAESGTWSQNRLGMALGVTPQAMLNALKRRDMRCGFVARALDMLGYELVAVPKGTRLPNGAHRVDAPEGE